MSFAGSEHSYISHPSRTAQILKEYGIYLKKRLGQNFLIDINILKKIAGVSELRKNESILEIGSGIGSLTEILLQNAKRIVCVEVDKRLIKAFLDIFNEKIGNNVILIEKDAMKLNYHEIAARYNIGKMVSNLPYGIAAPLILKVLVEVPQISKMYVTIQKDIAERLLAEKGSKNYNSYTIKANLLADFRLLFSVSRNCFIPVPNVDSAVIEVSTNKKSKLTNIFDFFEFVDFCFLHRRKKLINSIIAGGNKSGNKSYIDKMHLIIKMLNGIGKDEKVRAEELGLEEFLTIFNSIKK
ncbi:MAG: ribosomal RNA small subunit methyltransferase A [Actinobacteria bacterium]|nr:ribosomal RNA small subunit methyltransferase A [Actinomycetota bacterium]